MFVPALVMQLFGVLAFGYLLEPLLTKVYMTNVTTAGEKILATLRLELYRTLLMQRISFFDKHSSAELTSLISVELDAVRSFIFKWAICKFCYNIYVLTQTTCAACLNPFSSPCPVLRTVTCHATVVHALFWKQSGV